MIFYNVRIALKSLRRSPILTSLIIGGIMLGITVTTMFSTIKHSFAKDPIPSKSGQLYYVRMDSWDPARPYVPDQPTIPPNQLPYRDMVELMKSNIPVRQGGMYKASMWVSTGAKDARPERLIVRMCNADFFTMFNVPFLYGSGWSKSSDDGPEPVVVITSEQNDKLFGGENSVGRTLHIADRDFKVVGVTDNWRPSIKFYDLTQQYVQPPEPVYMPLNFTRPMKINTVGNSDGWRSSSAPGYDGFLASDICWIQYWVEIPTEAKLHEYEDWLAAYVMEQKKTGRYGRPLNNKVTPLPLWMVEQGVVPQEVKAMSVVSILFLAVCALNLTGLLLGKFLARSAEVGVRRALGARRVDIFLQHLIECELVGLLGGALGIIVSIGALALVNGWMKTILTRTDFFKIDLPMTLLAVGLSLLAGLIAGVYPAWRICRIAPAVHLKVQ